MIESEQQEHVGVAVDHGIEKRAELVTRFVRRATSPSTISKMPANTMTSPAQRKMPLANRIMAKMLISRPINVRMFG